MASVIIGTDESHPVDALLDTGASFNLIEMSLAEVFLGKTRSEIVAGGRAQAIMGVGSARRYIYGWKVSLRIKANEITHESLVMRDVWLYASDAAMAGYSILLGQSSGFEGRWLKHYNRAENRFWELRQLVEGG